MIVDFLLEFLAVAQGVVNVVIYNACQPFIVPQMFLVMCHFEHDLALYINSQENLRQSEAETYPCKDGCFGLDCL